MLNASIMAAASPRKSRTGERDPELKQTRKGNQWHMGIKLHVGVNDQTGLVHRLATISANVHNLMSSDQLLHGEDVHIWGMEGIRGLRSAKPIRIARLPDYIAMRPQGQSREVAREQLEWLMEQWKASMKGEVEHIFFM